jgi:hypothetical protein
LFVVPKFEIIFAPSFAPPFMDVAREGEDSEIFTGTLAQLVEQRTENPCVPGSIPGGTTNNPQSLNGSGGFAFWPTIWI